MGQLAFYDLSKDEEIAFIPKEEKHKKETTPAQLMIAERFKKARALSGLTEKDAISRMGLKNPKVISQIENCHRQPTLAFLIRAANAYGVSSDYLLGLSEDDDRSSDIATRSAIMRQNERAVSAIAKVLSQTTYDYAKAVGDESVKNLVNLSESLCQKIKRFCELNPDFDDMKGGASVQSLIIEITPVININKRKIEEREGIIELCTQQMEHGLQKVLFSKEQ